MATDPQTLLNQANCYNCNTPGEWMLMKLALLQQILLANNPMAATDPQSLLNIANCYNCYGPGLWPVLELALLSQIVASGGTGGGACIIGGVGPPVGNPPCNWSVYIQRQVTPSNPPNPGLWLGNTVTGWGNVIGVGPPP